MYGSAGWRLGLCLAVILSTIPSLAAGEGAGQSADSALTALKAGNERYIAHRLEHPGHTLKRMQEVEEAQHPFAVILGCADSRVPPEIVFDQGLGDLFVVRVAGAVPDDEVIGSIEYAVEHLHVQLVVVLGHEKCGAVTAAAAVSEQANHMSSFLDGLKPFVREAERQPGDLIHNAVCISVDRIAEALRASEPILENAVLENSVRIVGAHYDLHTGKVIWHNMPAPSNAAAPSESASL